MGRVAAVVSVAMLVACATSDARAEDEFLEQAGIGAGTALVNVLYIPAKLTYSVLGAVTGGLAYGLTVGDVDTAQGIWHPTMGGSYIVTPSMLSGEEPVRFSGSTPPADDSIGGEEIVRQYEGSQWPE